MKKSMNTQVKRILALILVAVLTTPYIAFAEEPPWHESAWEDSYLPEIEPIGFYNPLDYFFGDYNQAYLDLLAQTEELSAFTAVEMQDPAERDAIAFAWLMFSDLKYSELTESDRFAAFSQMGITYENLYDTSYLLTEMEQDGFSFADSVELLRIISSNLFDYQEAQTILEVFPRFEERLSELSGFEFLVQSLMQSLMRCPEITFTPCVDSTNVSAANPRTDVNVIFGQSRTTTTTVAAISFHHINETPESQSIANPLYEARQMFLSGNSVHEIERSLFATATEQHALPGFQTVTGYALSADYLSYHDTMDFAIAPASATHADITVNPFNLRLNADETVVLNTGAVVFRQHILSLPGRGGFGLNLDLVYNSSKAKTISGNIPNSPALGWMFDLPYLLPNVLHVPGRGTFALTGNNITGHYTNDMRLENAPGNFQSGNLSSTRVLRFNNGTSYYFWHQLIIGMVDRFGNTIRFEYVNNQLDRIIDTNGRVVSFTYETIGGGTLQNRPITITAPDASTFIINRHNVGDPRFGDPWSVSSVINQVGERTQFSHLLVRAYLNSHNALYQHLLLAGVEYPSRAQLWFEYRRYHDYLNNREVWRVSTRTLRTTNRYAAIRDFMRTTFTYFGRNSAEVGSTYGTIVAQNNGLRTRYTFNHRHLNTEQRAYDNNLALISRKTITYDNRNLPTAIELMEQRGSFSRTNRQTFTYNAYGQVTQTVSPLAQGSTLARYRTTFTYDSRFGLPLTKTFMPDALTTVVERNTLSSDGRRIIRTNIYENNVLRSRTDFFHDTFGNVTEIREFPNAAGSSFIATQITFSGGTLPSRIRTTGVLNADGTLLNGTGIVERSFTYNSMWRMLSETDPNGYITRWQYDRIGRVTQIDLPNGGFATYAYDDRNNTVTHRTVLGATYVYSYDYFGNLISITANGTQILHNRYDNRMRLVETQNAQGIASSQRQTFTYDVFDRVTEIRDISPTGAILRRETITYSDVSDAAGNSRIVTTIHGDTNAPSIQTFVQYNRFGRRTQEGTTGGRIFNYTHDLSGRVITETSLGINNTFTHNVFGIASVRNIEGNTSRNTYDGMGRLVTSSDFMGNYTRFYYDSLGRLIQRRVPFSRVGTITHYSATRYFYDRNGNLIRTATQINLPGQAEAWATTINTFRHNRLMSSQIGGTGVNGITTYYTYDLAGNILTKTVGAAITRFTYNNRGQLTRTTDALGQNETFTYDINGNLLTKTDRNGTLFRSTYDNMGRLIRQEAVQNNVLTAQRAYTFTATGSLRQATNGTHTITKRYDAQGRLIRQEETGDIIKTFAYNAANNRTHSRIYVNNARHIYNTYAYNAAQRLHTVRANGALLSTYTYNANGALETEEQSNFMRIYYFRNLAGLVRSTFFAQNSHPVLNVIYTHYLDGNISQIEGWIGCTSRKTYTYDTARRLIREQSTGGGVPDFTRQYTFDNRGNRTRMTVTGAEAYTVNYAYDLNNRLLTEVRTGTSPSTTTYTYDRNGNQLRRESGPTTFQILSYNAFNQQIGFGVNNAGGTFTYRADGLRHIDSAMGNVRNHVWNGSLMVMLRDGNGTVVNRYYRTPGGRLIRSYRDGWYFHNARGDVVKRRDNGGIFVHAYRYTAFGMEVSVSPIMHSNNPFRFAGEFWDGWTGIYYLRNRNFDPRTGRFTQPDPFWGIHNMQDSPAAQLQAANLFVFTANNPIMWVDPSGLAMGMPPGIMNKMEQRGQPVNNVVGWGVSSGSRGGTRVLGATTVTNEVMLRSIIEKNGGIVISNYNRWGPFGIFRGSLQSVTATVGENIRTYNLSDFKIVQGNVIIPAQRLVDDFGLNATQATHQAGDIFSSRTDAVMAFGLMFSQRSIHEMQEFGAAIEIVPGGFVFNHVAWSLQEGNTQNPWQVSVSANILTSAIVHTHWDVDGIPGFSPQDITQATYMLVDRGFINTHHYLIERNGGVLRMSPNRRGTRLSSPSTLFSLW